MLIFKKQVLAGLIAALAVGAANAQIFDGSTGNSSVLVTVYDKGGPAKGSATFDIGLRLSDFIPSASNNAPGTSLTFDLTSGNYASAWNSIKTEIGANTYYFAVQAINAPLTGFRTFLSTSGDPASTVNSEQQGPLNQFAQLNTYWQAVSGQVPAGTVKGATYQVANGGLNQASFADAQGETWVNQAVFSSVGTNTSPLQFWYLTAPSTGRGAATSLAVNYKLGVWSLNAATGQLVYSVPVPEPGTWALMLAGLIGVGAIARRRMTSNV